MSSEVSLSDLPNEALLRLPQVLAIVPVGRSTWLRGVATGRFPRPVHLPPRITAWKMQDIRELLASLPKA